jgi:hypothetical protein
VDNASALRELSAVLSSSAPLYARGIAIAQHLLTDGTGPAYVGDGEALASRLLEARAAMYGLDTTGVGRAHSRRRAPYGEPIERDVGRQRDGGAR